jgi:acyl carrier protein
MVAMLDGPSGSLASGLSRTVICHRLLPLLSDVREPVGSGEIDEAMGLLGHGLGFDSIEILSLVGALEEEFDITIDDTELKVAHFRTIGSLVTFLSAQLARR